MKNVNHSLNTLGDASEINYNFEFGIHVTFIDKMSP